MSLKQLTLALIDSKSSFVESIKSRVQTLSQNAPAFDVFQHTCWHFLECLSGIPDPEFVGRDYEIMNRIAGQIPLQTDSQQFAHAFVEIWFCENFHSPTWEHLVESRVENVQFAIEHACYVFAESSADGSSELIRLIRKTGSESLALTHFNRIKGTSSAPWLSRMCDSIAT